MPRWVGPRPCYAWAMRLGFVSTFPPMRCAIGIYTRELAKAIVSAQPDSKIAVFTEREVSASTDAGIEVHPIYRRGEDYVGALERAIVEFGCELVHLQHAGDLLGEDARLPKLLERLKQRGIASIVTLHTVYGGRGQLDRRHTDFYVATARAATRLIVHQHEGCATHLIQAGIPISHISVIPHGTTRFEAPDRLASRQRLQLPEDAFLFTFFGFIHLQKNVHRIVEAFAKIADEHPKARLLVAGMPWGNRWYNHLYTNLMKARVALSGLNSRILLRDAYVAPDQVPFIYGASDVILLPHAQTYGSASGVFHQAIGAAKPVLCAIGPKFVEARQALSSVPETCVPPRDTKAWSSAMSRLLEDPELLERARNAVHAYARATDWSKIATLHADCYAKALEGSTRE